MSKPKPLSPAAKILRDIRLNPDTLALNLLKSNLKMGMKKDLTTTVSTTKKNNSTKKK